MLKYSVKDSSVLCILLGIVFLIVGYSGLMANIFSAQTEYIGEYKVASFSNCKNTLENNNKVCIISNIFSDDAFFMPDRNDQQVIKGDLQLSIIWPDNSKNILIDWHKQASFIKCLGADSSFVQISPKCIECSDDTVGTADNLNVMIEGNIATIKYYNTQFNISGCTIKGQPKVRLQRKTIISGEKVLMTVSKAGKNITGSHSFDIQTVVPYSTAIARSTNHKAIIFFSALIAIGFLLFFVPEGNGKFLRYLRRRFFR